MSAWRYELQLAEGDFEARDVDAAVRITRRLNAALALAIERDPEVEAATMPHLRVLGSTKNYLQPRARSVESEA